MSLSATKGQRHFRGVLERGDRELGWTVIALPFDPRAAWPEMIRRRVCGELTGPAGSTTFRTSLFAGPGGQGSVLLVNRRMQQEAGVGLGAVADVTLRPDLEERPAELPEELDRLLNEAEGLRRWYEELSESTRREIARWVDGVKGGDARERRAQQTAERLLSAMEAEAALPPLLENAFRKRPKAQLGWARMSARQRRAGLLAVFAYQSVEARQRRVDKLLDEAETHGR